MPKSSNSIKDVSEIRVAPQPSGLRAVFMVETASRTEAHEVKQLFSDLESQVQVRQLSDGKLVSYAVQAHETDTGLLDEIEDVLRNSYGFVVSHRSFDEIIYRVVRELSSDTESKLVPVHGCNICGKIDPFPTTVVSLSDEDGSVLLERCYCSKCTAEASATSNKEFIRSLLAADEQDFGKLAQAEFVRRPTKKQPMRFRIKSGSEEIVQRV